MTSWIIEALQSECQQAEVLRTRAKAAYAAGDLDEFLAAARQWEVSLDKIELLMREKEMAE